MEFENFFQNKEDKDLFTKHIHNLYIVALSDAAINEDELNLIKERISSLGLSEEDEKMILSKGAEVDILSTHSEADIVAMMYDMVLVMLVDGKVNDREYNTIQKIGVAMGVKPEIISNLIRDVNHLIANEVNMQFLIDKYKENLN